MEFKLKDINENADVTIKPFMVGRNYVAFLLEHNGSKYNSLFDDCVYVYGSAAKKVSVDDLKVFVQNTYLFFNSKGVHLPSLIYNLSESCMHNNNDLYEIVERLRRNNLYFHHQEEPDEEEKVIYVDRKIITEKIVAIPQVLALNELDDCPICCNDKAYISSGCCSLRQCLSCAIKMCTKKSCPQCRKHITLDKLNHTLFPTAT